MRGELILLFIIILDTIHSLSPVVDKLAKLQNKDGSFDIFKSKEDSLALLGIDYDYIKRSWDVMYELRPDISDFHKERSDEVNLKIFSTLCAMEILYTNHYIPNGPPSLTNIILDGAHKWLTKSEDYDGENDDYVINIYHVALSRLEEKRKVKNKSEF